MIVFQPIQDAIDRAYPKRKIVLMLSAVSDEVVVTEAGSVVARIGGMHLHATPRDQHVDLFMQEIDRASETTP